MSIVIISFTCCFLQIYDDFYGPFFNDISGGILNDYLHIGNEEYCFGQLNNNGKLNITNLTLLNRHLYGADQLESNKCIQCTYLPICNGGCPLQRIENLYEGQSETNCSIYRYSIIQLLKFHISAKRKLYTIK